MSCIFVCATIKTDYGIIERALKTLCLALPYLSMLFHSQEKMNSIVNIIIENCSRSDPTGSSIPSFVRVSAFECLIALAELHYPAIYAHRAQIFAATTTVFDEWIQKNEIVLQTKNKVLSSTPFKSEQQQQQQQNKEEEVVRLALQFWKTVSDKEAEFKQILPSENAERQEKDAMDSEKISQFVISSTATPMLVTRLFTLLSITAAQILDISPNAVQRMQFTEDDADSPTDSSLDEDCPCVSIHNMVLSTLRSLTECSGAAMFDTCLPILRDAFASDSVVSKAAALQFFSNVAAGCADSCASPLVLAVITQLSNLLPLQSSSEASSIGCYCAKDAASFSSFAATPFFIGTDAGKQQQQLMNPSNFSSSSQILGMPVSSETSCSSCASNQQISLFLRFSAASAIQSLCESKKSCLFGEEILKPLLLCICRLFHDEECLSQCGAAALIALASMNGNNLTGKKFNADDVEETDEETDEEVEDADALNASSQQSVNYSSSYASPATLSSSYNPSSSDSLLTSQFSVRHYPLDFYVLVLVNHLLIPILRDPNSSLSDEFAKGQAISSASASASASASVSGQFSTQLASSSTSSSSSSSSLPSPSISCYLSCLKAASELIRTSGSVDESYLTNLLPVIIKAFDQSAHISLESIPTQANRTDQLTHSVELLLGGVSIKDKNSLFSIPIPIKTLNESLLLKDHALILINTILSAFKTPPPFEGIHLLLSKIHEFCDALAAVCTVEGQIIKKDSIFDRERSYNSQMHPTDSFFFSKEALLLQEDMLRTICLCFKCLSAAQILPYFCHFFQLIIQRSLEMPDVVHIFQSACSVIASAAEAIALLLNEQCDPQNISAGTSTGGSSCQTVISVLSSTFQRVAALPASQSPLPSKTALFNCCRVLVSKGRGKCFGIAAPILPFLLKNAAPQLLTNENEKIEGRSFAGDNSNMLLFDVKELQKLRHSIISFVIECVPLLFGSVFVSNISPSSTLSSPPSASSTTSVFQLQKSFLSEVYDLLEGIHLDTDNTVQVTLDIIELILLLLPCKLQDTGSISFLSDSPFLSLYSLEELQNFIDTIKCTRRRSGRIQKLKLLLYSYYQPDDSD
ncbi:uncharacterized protein MONOS_8490 [Monocercomonoides exilis]|uniref:uncharacterized protein n=1 Tax=Monocercomonoides exilis TaxID=2049356 RepID=UPI0035596121|nr:hypothetical protein MONOS_8490 [Monocercomonoides exilis]|eukprot:MONOS_8490.1-p1 / transcript=MONOS_8490.1 / gene=MONOS_8490 / organism=Monocercomonoides_exilis_PA203 / gene_product=unspecified product / transcript_product=unspecified product / location=Mono_scaffold00321:24206-27484(-) / protein_length=1093 / sequence_SO=supercontig / SO=protein_coding / is_pseudo=false